MLAIMSPWVPSPLFQNKKTANNSLSTCEGALVQFKRCADNSLNSHLNKSKPTRNYRKNQTNVLTHRSPHRYKTCVSLAQHRKSSDQKWSAVYIVQPLTLSHSPLSLSSPLSGLYCALPFNSAFYMHKQYGLLLQICI